MKEKILSIYSKYKDIIPYAIFGVLTTVVNVVVYWVCSNPLGLGVSSSTVIAWILAVLFAYLTNRKWVFHSEAKGFKAIAIEVVSFFACRLATGVVDWAGMMLLVEKMGFNEIIIKILMNIIVIVLNYVASKLVIFAKKK